MKCKAAVCLLLLVTGMLGCSKPEPPAIQKRVSPKTSPVNTNVNDSSTAHRPSPSPAMGSVRVIDADSGLPISHATVRACWKTEDGCKICFGEHIQDGEYRVVTNGIKGTFYIGAFAKGYILNNLENPVFPVELALKKGETIEVSGFIMDENGTPVTNGTIHLLPINFNRRETTRPYLYPCSVNPDCEGKFTMANAPVGTEKFYLRYECPDTLVIDFNDQAFSTTNGDVYLTLQLPPELTVKGRVLFSSGSAVSGAWVWVEEVTGEQPDAWNKNLSEKSDALCKAVTQSDADGCFNLTVPKVMDRYVVKALYPFFEVTYKGPYSDTILPSDCVELIIREEGSRLYGTLKTCDGDPVTECGMWYSVWKKDLKSMSGRPNSVNLDIAPDGSYTSGIVPPGMYDLTFKAEGFYFQNKKVAIRKNTVEQCDVIFIPFCTITGTVYDAETRQPIPDVALVKPLWLQPEKQTYSNKTDQNGKFWVLCCNNFLSLEFQHPDYAATSYQFFEGDYNYYGSRAEVIKKFQVDVFLSKKASICVYARDHDGTPLDGYDVFLGIKRKWQPQGNYQSLVNNQRAELVKGIALLTNVPVTLNPVYVGIRGKGRYNALAKSDFFDVVAGKESSVNLQLPPCGSLALSFLYPFNRNIIKIDGRASEQRFNIIDFTCDKQTMFLDKVPTNIYHIIIKGSTAVFLETNVVISANNTTKLIVDNNTNELGVIKGTITTLNDEFVRCDVTVIEQTTKKTTTSASLYSSKEFIIRELSLDKLYDLKIMIYEGSGTNITITGVKPDGPDLDIKLPVAYRITGNIIDSEGKPLKAYIGIPSTREYEPGEFVIYPVFPGTYTLRIKTKEYPTVEREVTVYDSNVDLGDIMINP